MIEVNLDKGTTYRLVCRTCGFTLYADQPTINSPGTRYSTIEELFSAAKEIGWIVAGNNLHFCHYCSKDIKKVFPNAELEYARGYASGYDEGKTIAENKYKQLRKKINDLL